MKKVLSLIAFSIIAVSAQEYQQPQEQQQVIPQQQQEYQQQPQQAYPPQQQMYQQPQQAYPPQQQMYQQPQQAYPPQQQIYQQPQQGYPQQVQSQQEKEKEKEKRMRFGIRAAWGLNGLSGSNFSNVDGPLEGSWRYGWGAGILTLTDISFAFLNAGASIAYKKTSGQDITVTSGRNTYNYRMTTDEMALEIPILLRFPFWRFYFDAGPQLNLVFSPEIETSNAGSLPSSLQAYIKNGTENYKDRNSIDFGITVGLGFNFGKHFALDSRYFYGLLTDFDKEAEGTLYQMMVGANILF